MRAQVAGSIEVGRAIMRGAADDLTGALVAKFRNTGQAWVAANRFVVEAPVAQAFTHQLVAAVAQLRLGRGTEPCGARRSSARSSRSAPRATKRRLSSSRTTPTRASSHPAFPETGHFSGAWPRRSRSAWSGMGREGSHHGLADNTHLKYLAQRF